MAFYNWLLAAGGLLTLIATSEGIWEFVVPGQRRSPVPLMYGWRALSLTFGVLLLGIGLGGLIYTVFC